MKYLILLCLLSGCHKPNIEPRKCPSFFEFSPSKGIVEFELQPELTEKDIFNQK